MPSAATAPDEAAANATVLPVISWCNSPAIRTTCIGMDSDVWNIPAPMPSNTAICNASVNRALSVPFSQETDVEAP